MPRTHPPLPDEEREERSETPDPDGRVRRVPLGIVVVSALLLGLLAVVLAPEDRSGPPEAPGRSGPAPTAEPTSTSLPPERPPPRTRSALAWPFSATSIWNTSIGSGAELRPVGFTQPPNGYTVDTQVIVMAPDAPLREVVTFDWPARCARPDDRTAGVLLPVPDDVVVSPESPDWEGVTPNLAGAVLLPDGRTVQELGYVSRCEPAGPLAVAADGLRGQLDLFGDGLGRDAGGHGGHGASLLSALGGTIRLGELTGPEPIRHVTKIGVDCPRWCRPDGDRNAFRWPALAADATSTVHYGSNATREPTLAMGSLVAIPPDVDLSAIGLETAPARALGLAWQRYGAYVVDSTGEDDGWGQQALMVEYGVISELAAVGIDATTWAPGGWEDTAWNRDLNRLFGLLHEVVNQGPDAVGGGGTPGQPPAPPFDDAPTGATPTPPGT